MPVVADDLIPQMPCGSEQTIENDTGTVRFLNRSGSANSWPNQEGR